MISRHRFRWVLVVTASIMVCANVAALFNVIGRELTEAITLPIAGFILGWCMRDLARDFDV
jgi:hypothetical protein